MKRIRILCALLALLTAAVPAVSAAEVLSGDVYCFASSDFSGDDTLAGICITAVDGSGVLRLGSRLLQPGDTLTREQLDQITFHAAEDPADREASVTYLPIYSDRVEAAEVMAIAVIGRQNQAPVAEDSALETYRNLPNEAMLKVKDPEGKPMTFTITRTPKRGDVVIRQDGSFIYTPRKNKVGIDSFTYTATDEAGNVSREATVTVTVLKPSAANPYTDTVGKSCRFAAEWMKNTGIFVSENINGNGCFQPEKQVSRADFLTMLVGALEIPLEEGAEYTGYTDDTPRWLKPYLAAAMRSGLTAGWPEGDKFRPDAPITGAEAAVMLQNALDLAAETVETDEDVNVWAREAVSALSSHGIHLTPEAALTRGDAAQIIYRVSQLKDSAPGMMALRNGR